MSGLFFVDTSSVAWSKLYWKKQPSDRKESNRVDTTHVQKLLQLTTYLPFVGGEEELVEVELEVIG